VTDILVTDAGVVGALRGRIAGRREAERAAVLVEEIFLLEAEPRARIVEDGCAHVRGMRAAVGQHDFAQYEHTVGMGAVRIDRNRLKDAIGAMPFGLLGRAAVKAPKRKLLECRKRVVVFELSLATQVWHRLVTVEPNVLELVLCHFRFSLADDPEGRDAHASSQRRAAANCRGFLSIKYAKDRARAPHAASG